MASTRAQVEIEQQINAAIEARAELMAANKGHLADQIALAQELCRAMECRELEGFQERMAEVKEGLLEAADASGELANQTDDVNKAMKKATKSSFSWKAAGVGAFVAVKNAAGKVFSILGSIGSLMGSIVSGAFNVVKLGLQAYNSMIDGLLQKGQELHNGTSEIRQAMEKLRAEFGNLAKGEGGAVMKAWDGLNARGQRFAGTGLRMARVFGSGPGGQAAMMELLQEKATEMGGAFSRLQGDFEAAGEEVIIASKALGLTGEAMAALTITGRAHGKTMKQTLQELKIQVVQVSKAYGVNTKITGKMIDQMAKAPEIFGTDTKEMLKMSVAAQKLGVSIETLGKATAVFDDFESGAKAAAELASQFGVTVDAMDMMTATPAEQVTMLKDALQESGQSFDDMSRQEKARMADLTKMDMTELQNLMDPTNAFDSNAMDDVNSGVDAATRATMAQTEANKELVKVMERVIEQGEQLSGQGGLLGAFLDGVSKGIGRSEEFRHIILNIYETFKIVDRAGQRVGLMLAELFGADGPFYVVTQFFDELFNPTIMRERMRRIEGFFRTFVDTVKAGGVNTRHAFSDLIESIIGEFFGGGEGGGPTFLDRMLDGLHIAFDFIGGSLISLAPMLFDGLKALFDMGIDMLTNGLKAPEIGVGLAEDGLFPMIQAALNDPKLKDAWTGLADSFMAFVDKFWGMYGDTISAALGKVLGLVIAAAFVQSIPYIVGAGVIGGFVKKVMSLIMGGFGDAAPAPPGGAPPQPGMGDKLADLAAGMKLAIEELASIGLTNAVKAAAVLLILGGAFGLALIGIIHLAVKAQESGASPKMLLVFAALIYAIAKAMESMADIIAAINGYGTIPRGMRVRDIMKALPVLGALVLVVMAIGATIVGMTMALGAIKNPPDEKTVEAARSLTITLLMATAAIVGMGAVLAILAAAAAGPGIVLIIAMLAAATAVFWGVSKLLVSLVEQFGAIDMDTAKSAAVSACAAGAIVVTLVELVNLLSTVIRGSKIDDDAFEKAAIELAAVVDIMADRIMPAVERAGAAITSDPRILREKIEIFLATMEAFSPFANMMEAALKLKNLNPEQMATLIDQISGSMETMFAAMAGMVNTIVENTKDMTPQQMQSAEAAAGLMTSVAEIMRATIPPAKILEDTVLESQASLDMATNNMLGASYSRVAGTAGQYVARKSEVKMAAYYAQLGDALEGLAGPIETLVTRIANIEFGDTPISVIVQRSKGMTAIFGALKSFGEAMRSMLSSDEGSLAEVEARANRFRLAFAIRESGTYSPIMSINVAFDGMNRFYMAWRSVDIVGVLAWNAKFFVAFGKMAEAVGDASDQMGSGSILAAPAALMTEMDGYAGVFTGERAQIMTEFLNLFGDLSQVALAHDYSGLVDIVNLMNSVLDLSADMYDFSIMVDSTMFDPLVDVLESFAYISQLANLSNQHLDKVPALMNTIDELGPKITEWAMTAGMWSMYQPLADVVMAFNELGESMGSAQNIVDIETTLQRVGKALKVDGQRVMVERGDVQIMVNFKINMEGGKLSQVLVMNKLVKAGTSFAPPLNMKSVYGTGEGY